MSDTATAQGARVNVSSYMTGNRMQEMTAGTIADILTAQQINTAECQIDVIDAQGNDKSGSPNTSLSTGDTVQIMRKQNKSGRLDIDTTVTEVTHIHSLPLKATPYKPRSVYNHRFHQLKRKGQSFDVQFRPRNEREQKAILHRVTAAKNYFRKQKDNSRKQFVTTLLTTKPSGNGSPTHIIRVWRSK